MGHRFTAPYSGFWRLKLCNGGWVGGWVGATEPKICSNAGSASEVDGLPGISAVSGRGG